MKFLWQVSLCCLVFAGVAAAQRGGGGFGGGMRGGVGGGIGNVGFPGANGGFISGGLVGGGANGGFINSGLSTGRFNGNFGFFPFGFGVGNLNGSVNPGGHIRGGFAFPGDRDGDGAGFQNGFFGSGFGGFGYLPFGYGYPYYWPDYAYSSYFPGYNYPYQVSGYNTYQPSANVTVLYPVQGTVPPLSAERARPVMHEYDQNGQEVRPGVSTLYLIAFKDHNIVAATTYRVEGNTLHYTTQQNENKDASLDTVDTALSMKLNRERQVPFNLPPQ